MGKETDAKDWFYRRGYIVEFYEKRERGLHKMEKRYLCLDIGGTSVKYGVCSQDGEILTAGKEAIGKTLDEFLDQIQAIYEKNAPVEGIAGSFPGEVHSEEGVIYGISAVMHLHKCPLKQLISQRCGGKKVTMVNDANAAALGEAWLGVGKKYQNIAFAIVGSGVGGAVIENGELYPGTTMNKAEIGNFLMGGVKDGELQCWSCFTLEKEAQRYSREHQVQVSGKELADMARQGDKEAAERVDEFLHYMAEGCLILQFAYDPEIIAIGGGISANPWIIEEINRTYREMVKGQQMEYLMPVIVACERGNDANILGALSYFFKYGGD